MTCARSVSFWISCAWLRSCSASKSGRQPTNRAVTNTKEPLLTVCFACMQYRQYTLSSLIAIQACLECHLPSAKHLQELASPHFRVGAEGSMNSKGSHSCGNCSLCPVMEIILCHPSVSFARFFMKHPHNIKLENVDHCSSLRSSNDTDKLCMLCSRVL